MIPNTIDMSDWYCTYAICTREPVYMDDMSVLVTLPADVDMQGNINPDTTYLSLVVVPAEFPNDDVWKYFEHQFGRFGIFSRQQVGHIRKVVVHHGV